MPDGSDGIRHPWPAPPAEGEAVEVAEGILWMRLPLPMALDHVNVYALRDADGWTLIDAGLASNRTRAIWERLLAGPLAAAPVARVLVTHHHPDHVGLAGWFAARGAEIWTTRTAYLTARMLTLDAQDRPDAATLRFWRRAGMAPDVYAERAGSRPFNFADTVAPLPLGFRRIEEGEVLRLGGRDWTVRLGDGHAPDHVTLWSEDIVVAGDQIIPGISPNIGVYATEPEADPVGEWLAACARLAPHAREGHLVLPGHKLPFTGLPLRMRQLAENHHGALARLLRHIATPRTAHDCFVPLFRREITGSAYGLALVEAVAHLNHLHRKGQVVRHLEGEAWVWQAAATAAAKGDSTGALD